MFVYIVTFLAIVNHILCGLYIIVHWVAVASCIGIWYKGYKLAVQYVLTQDAQYASHGRDPVQSYIVTDVCIYNPENTNNWKYITERGLYCMMVLLLQQYWLELVNMRNSEF
jgi:hypothetical protein